MLPSRSIGRIVPIEADPVRVQCACSSKDEAEIGRMSRLEQGVSDRSMSKCHVSVSTWGMHSPITIIGPITAW